MKRVFFIISVILLLTGCTDDSFECNKDIYNDIQEYKMTAKYKVYYKNSYVTKIEKIEIYESDNMDTLNYFDVSKKLEYVNLNKLYGEVIYNVSKDETKVMVESVIDTEMLDIKKMKKDDYIDSNAVVNDKITINGIKNIYKSQGFICES